MFKKLLSNLPFNPSLINQVAFYAKRMHAESAMRRIAFVFIILTMCLQVFAVISPPEQSFAKPPNDIVDGGIGSAAGGGAKCDNNVQDFKTILEYYGISCDTLRHANPVRLNSRALDNQLLSLGRTQPGETDKKGGPSGRYAVNIPGLTKQPQTLWMKNLSYWDSGASSTYDAVELLSSKTGEQMWILIDCGNIVTKGRFSYTPPVVQKPVEKPVEQPKDYCLNKPGTQPATDDCDMCPLTKGIQLDATKCDVCPNVAGPQYNLSDCDVCPNIPQIQSDASQCYPCPKSQTQDDLDSCLTFDKKASNDTKKITDTNKKKAAAGDVITYTLKVTNTGKVDFKDFIVKESLNDVLEYSTVVDLHGGVINDLKEVSWPKQTIAAGATIQKQITVKILDPIPSTPTPKSDPGSYDLIMTNVFYGKQVDIYLPQPPIKIIETTTTLPNTGPGTSIAIGFGVTAVMGYFFARARLFANELDIIRDEYAVPGGY